VGALDVKGMVSRDSVVGFLVSFDRSEIHTHTERVRLLLKLRFRIKFFRLSGVGLMERARYFYVGFTFEIKKELRIIVQL
jgi:hypothetical protein